MARFWQSGFELNSTTNGVEWGATTGSPTITSTAAKVRSGTYAGQISSLVSATQKYFQFTLAAANANGPYFVSFYIFFDTLPSAANTVFAFTASNGSNILLIKCDNTGAFTLWNAGTQIGSASSTIATGGQHKIDVKFDNSGGAGAGVMTAQLDGVQFASSTTLSIGTGIQTINFGGNIASEAQTTGTWYFDDIKLNDSTGANETSYPGSGQIIHMHPSAAGDNTAWTLGAGTSNWNAVSETTPDDATSFVDSKVTGNLDDYATTGSSVIGSSDTINLVAVGVRFASNSAGAASTFVARIKAASGGTVSEGSSIIPAGTSYQTNAPSDPKNYSLVSYTQPGSTAWTKAALGTMQIGLHDTSGNGIFAKVTNIWASVDYTPAVVTSLPPGLKTYEQAGNRAGTY